MVKDQAVRLPAVGGEAQPGRSPRDRNFVARDTVLAQDGEIPRLQGHAPGIH